MPASPGEALLTTLFADVHYYFSENRSPSQPQHHRFDKHSYVYLYHNSDEEQTKLEVANHAGTPDQSSFHGYTDIVTVQNSYLQPTLFTFAVNLREIKDRNTWHLETFNEKNEKKFVYPIHFLDIYFWTEKDAATFLQHVKASISPERLMLKERGASKKVQHAEHRDSMSPVVQQLEKTAIGAQFPQRTGSTISTSSFPGPPPPPSSLPPPPAAPAPAPAAYNPAAPAAPEPVTYREKTPPPPDDGTGTGLKAAAQYDVPPPQQASFGPYAGAGQYTNSFSPPPTQFSGPPRQGSISSIPGAPTSAPSFGPMAASTITPPIAAQSPPSFGPGAAQYATAYSAPPGQQNPYLPPTPSAPPAYTAPGMPGMPPGMPPGYAPGYAVHPDHASPPPQQQQPAPVGGYSAYTYTTHGNGAAVAGDVNVHGAYVGDMHSQLYRPTEAEANSHGHGHRHAAPPAAGLQSPDQNAITGRPKLDEGFNRLEGKMSKYLNRLDKLW